MSTLLSAPANGSLSMQYGPLPADPDLLHRREMQEKQQGRLVHLLQLQRNAARQRRTEGSLQQCYNLRGSNAHAVLAGVERQPPVVASNRVDAHDAGLSRHRCGCHDVAITLHVPNQTVLSNCRLLLHRSCADLNTCVDPGPGLHAGELAVSSDRR